ncbi:MAG: elongation factor G, partial [Smithellaceae bacterium]|nr:elongation factor G [Smithellaceae bacterium]
LSVINRLTGENPPIPPEFHPFIEEGIREASLSGTIAGYPVTDVRIIIIGGGYREGESSSLGYKIAASSAFRDGCLQGEPVLLEPIMSVDIITPSEFMGEVIGDINARKGEIHAVKPKGVVSEIEAKVPLKQMFGYSTDLRSATQGRAVFTMRFSAYDKG